MALHLKRAGMEFKLYESSNKLGGHANTLKGSTNGLILVSYILILTLTQLMAWP